MKSFEVALKERIGQKRQAREEAERRRQKEKAKAGDRARQVVAHFKREIGNQYDIDLSTLDVRARESDGRYRVTIAFDEGYVALANEVLLQDEGIKIVPLEEDAVIWHASHIAHGEMHIRNENFLDACIYAIHGTSEPAS